VARQVGREHAGELIEQNCRSALAGLLPIGQSVLLRESSVWSAAPERQDGSVSNTG
jgi:hypothetical protein